MKELSADDPKISSFWPATVLSLILCSTILAFARVSDMYGGYPVFMVAVFWLCIWSFIAGFSSQSLILLDVCRAMQGMAIAAYTPATFTMFGSIYPAGPRRNFALGVYGAMAPLGLYVGMCVSAALPSDSWSWYFFIAAILAGISLILAYLSVPSDRTDRLALDMSMDWAGAITITSGLILIAYALAASATNSTLWTSAGVLVPFLIGMASLIAGAVIEMRYATCPLLPMDFFTPKSVKPFALACLFFYGCFGTWLFTSTTYLQSAYKAHGILLAAYFTPVAIGGFIIASTSGTLLHVVPPTLLLLLSGLAWVGAPLLLALGKPDAGYWAIPFPSMICSTLGIDITFTISVVFLSSVQPLKYQGMAGAVSSVLVNMGIAFSLAFAGIIEDKVGAGMELGPERVAVTSRAAYLFATGSAAVGMVIVALFVRVSRSTVDEKKRAASVSVDVESGLISAVSSPALSLEKKDSVAVTVTQVKEMSVEETQVKKTRKEFMKNLSKTGVFGC